MSEHRNVHKMVIDFDGCGGPSVDLICPEGGCEPADDGPPDECCLAPWVENLDPTEILRGRVEVSIEPEWDEETVTAHIIDPEVEDLDALADLHLTTIERVVSTDQQQVMRAELHAECSCGWRGRPWSVRLPSDSTWARDRAAEDATAHVAHEQSMRRETEGFNQMEAKSNE